MIAQRILLISWLRGYYSSYSSVDTTHTIAQKRILLISWLRGYYSSHGSEDTTHLMAQRILLI